MALVAVAAAGCFDVHLVDTGPFVFDDFNDQDTLPNDSHFQAWECYTTSPAGQPCRCEVGSSDSSPALILQATITDPLDGMQQHGGAALKSRAWIPVDLSRITRIEFRDMVQAGSPPIPDNAELHVEIGCETAASTDGGVPGDLFVLSLQVGYAPTWQARSVNLAEFGPWPSDTEHVEGGPPACLRQAGSLRFKLDAKLLDGATGAFTMGIDDVTFF
jgi:hypothetical protein